MGLGSKRHRIPDPESGSATLPISIPKKYGKSSKMKELALLYLTTRETVEPADLRVESTVERSTSLQSRLFTNRMQSLIFSFPTTAEP